MATTSGTSRPAQLLTYIERLKSNFSVVGLHCISTMILHICELLSRFLNLWCELHIYTYAVLCGTTYYHSTVKIWVNITSDYLDGFLTVAGEKVPRACSFIVVFPMSCICRLVANFLGYIITKYYFKNRSTFDRVIAKIKSDVMFKNTKYIVQTDCDRSRSGRSEFWSLYTNTSRSDLAEMFSLAKMSLTVAE